MVIEAKSRAYVDFYQKLDTKEGEKHIFNLAKARSRQMQDLGTMKYIKDEGKRLLFRQEDIKMRWHQYFSQLLNETRGVKEKGRKAFEIQRTLDHGLTSDITTEEVGKALKMMGRTKAIGPDNISIEVWRGLGEEDIR